jgi:hypothetical protein
MAQVRALASVGPVFGRDLPLSEAFTTTVTEAYTALRCEGARKAVADPVGSWLVTRFSADDLEIFVAGRSGSFRVRKAAQSTPPSLRFGAPDRLYGKQILRQQLLATT